MAHVTAEYVNSLPEIYRDILATFPEFEPSRKVGYGLAFQSLFTRLSSKYSLAQIRVACDRMAQGGAVKIQNGIFVCPTEIGEDIIAELTGTHAQADETVADFPKPPA